MPLKSVWRQSAAVACEKNLKKARFLEEVCNDLLARSQVFNRQLRELNKTFSLVSARALGSLEYVFNECWPLLEVDGFLCLVVAEVVVAGAKSASCPVNESVCQPLEGQVRLVLGLAYFLAVVFPGLTT